MAERIIDRLRQRGFLRQPVSDGEEPGVQSRHDRPALRLPRRVARVGGPAADPLLDRIDHADRFDDLPGEWRTRRLVHRNIRCEMGRSYRLRLPRPAGLVRPATARPADRRLRDTMLVADGRSKDSRVTLPLLADRIV